MIKYKLIGRDRKTYGGMEWPIGTWNEATGDLNQGLCSDAYLHCYDDPYLALLLNPIHANIVDPIVCEVEVDGECESDCNLKRGYRRMRVIRDLPDISVTIEQRVEFAILCAMEVYSDSDFIVWATAWRNGYDRTAEAAASRAAAAEAAEAAGAAARAAAWAAADSLDLSYLANKAIGKVV